MQCSACHAENPEKARFCNECGKKLPEVTETPRQKPPEHAEQRKLVTVLFADISGFTAMSETLDPEDLTGMIRELWGKIDSVITSNAGHIDKHIGDAVMAIWGVEQASETDPERAIRAAMGMQKALGEFRREKNAQLSMRIGINTGAVLLGEVGSTHEFTAMGDTVNTASRLEGAAPINRILVSSETYQHTRRLFDFERCEPITVKGKNLPLQVYLVQREKPLHARMSNWGLEGVETRMLGRDAELAQLKSAFQQVIRENKPQIVTVVGEAGVGKSRLLFEFGRWLDLQREFIQYLRGRATEQSRGMGNALWRDAFAFRFEIRESDPRASIWRKIEMGVAEFLPDENTSSAHVFGAWLGYDFKDSPHLAGLQNDPEQLNHLARLYLSRWFRQASALAPVVLLLEDIHWADIASLDALIDLINRSANVPILVICLTRESLYEHNPDWDSRFGSQHKLRLEPLSKETSTALVREILKEVQPPPEKLAELIVRRAEGNPFFAEEIVKMLMDNGVIQTGENPWRVAVDDLSEIKIPSVLTGVLQARLEQLTASERQALQCATVIGRYFWDQAVSHLLERSDIRSNLSALLEKEIILLREGSAFEGATEYFFKHALLHEVTYESTLKAHRRQYHKRAAEWFENATTASQRQDEYAGVIARHFELAGESGTARRWYTVAGEKAAMLFNRAAAIDSFIHALALSPDDNERFELLVRRIETRRDQGQWAASNVDVDEAEALAEKLRLPNYLAEIAMFRAVDIRTDNQTAENFAYQALSWAEKSGDLLLQAEAHRLLGRACIENGKYTEAKQNFDFGLELARKVKSKFMEGKILNNLGRLVSSEGFLSAGYRYRLAALQIAFDVKDWRLQSVVLSSIIDILRRIGNYTESIKTADQALILAQEMDWQFTKKVTLLNKGETLHNQGKYQDSIECFEAVLSLAKQFPDPVIAAWAHTGIGFSRLEMEDFEAAANAFVRAREIWDAQKNLTARMECSAGLAKTKLTQEHLEDALLQIESILDVIGTGANINDTEEPLRILLVCYQVLSQAGDARAQSVLEKAYNDLQANTEKLDPQDRVTYLENVPWHREIIRLWSDVKPER